jgi:hypothetical protein
MEKTGCALPGHEAQAMKFLLGFLESLERVAP